MIPFKTEVAVQTNHGVYLYKTDRRDAEGMVNRRLADPILEGRGFCGVVRLRLSLGALRDMYSDKQPRKPKGRPRPTLRADSSTGDAGRGLGALLGHRRVLHYGPGIRA